MTGAQRYPPVADGRFREAQRVTCQRAFVNFAYAELQSLASIGLRCPQNIAESGLKSQPLEFRKFSLRPKYDFIRRFDKFSRCASQHLAGNCRRYEVARMATDNDVC